MPSTERPSLPQQVAASLRAELRRRRPGERLPTEVEMAGRYGVSVGTLRSALQALAATGLIVRRQGSGTYVAARASAGHVALFTGKDLFAPGASPFFPGIFGAVRRSLDAAGVVSCVYSGHLEDDYVCPELDQALEQGHLRGIAAIMTDPGPWYETAKTNGLPVVGTNSAFEYCVQSDWRRLGRQGARYLAEQGRENIALLGWARQYRDSTDDPEFIGGFVDELTRHGLGARNKWMRTDLPPSDPGAGWEGFREIWSAYPEKPDGLLVTDDMLFRDAALAIAELGIRVPGQLLIVTHANVGRPMRTHFPAVRLLYDVEAAGTALAGMMTALLAGGRPAPAQRTVLHRLDAPVNVPETGRVPQR